MSINPEFKPIEDFYVPEQKPLSAAHLPIEAYRDDPGSMLMPNDAPVLPLKESKRKPGFFSTLGHAFSEYNEFAQTGRFIAREAEFLHPADDDVPDGFDANDIKYLKDYPPNYWDFISEGQSPNDVAARQQYVLSKVTEQEEFANGSFAASLLGGFAGGVLSPSSYLPFAAAVKYASIAENVIKGTLQAAPYVALQAVAHEGFMQATDAGGNLEDFAINSIRDAAFGVAFMAGGAGLGAAYRGGKLWNVRKMANYNYEGIDFNHVIDPETGGVTGGIKASSAPGYSLSAAKVEQAQQFADSALHHGFLFGIPGVSKLAGNSILGSPIVQAFGSRFQSVRAAIDSLASHSLITKGVMQGRARPDAAEDLMSQINAGAVNFNLQYRGHFMEENGIEGGYNVKNATKALRQRALKGQQTSWEDFNYKVIDSTISQDFNYSKSINAASKLYTEYTDSLYKELLGVKGFDQEILSPRNARGYYTQNMDTIALVKRQDNFRQVVADEFKRQDGILESITAPLESAQKFLRQLEEHKLSGQAHDRSMVNEIKEARDRVREIQRDIERRARDQEDDDVALLLEDRNFLTLDEADELRALHAPHNEAKNLAAEARVNVNKLKGRLSAAKSSAKKNVTKEATKRNIEKMKALEKEIAAAEEKVREAEINQATALDELEQRAHKGEIKSKFFTKDQNVINFRNPDEWARFRKPFGSDAERIAAAEAQRNLYLNNTTEQIQQSMLGSSMPSLFANPLGRRTFMIPAKVLNDSRFLASDVPKAAASYARTLGRHIALGKVFKDINMLEGEHGAIGLARILGEERTKMELEINSNKEFSEEQRTKELVKLDRDFRKAQTLMKNLFDTFMGKTNASAATLRVTRAIKNFAASTKLGGVPISQVTDIGAIILKHGLWNYLRDGLTPFIKTLNGYVDSELSEVAARNAADAHLALQHVEVGYSSRYSDNLSQGDVPIGLHLESALEKVGHLSGNFFGTNFIENANQRIVAGIMQSKIMRGMYDFREGKLSKTDEMGLLQYGIDPKVWSERFIKSFEEGTGWKEKTGAYQSKYWEWKDNEAVARMAGSIRRGVYDTIIQKGMFNSPFWTNNPILGMIFMFHGWGFSAFNKYTVPMLQRADAQKLQGIVFMLGLGAMTDPLRKLANGKKADTDNDDTWFGKAFETVSNSGILGHTPDLLQTANKFLGGELLPKTTERYQGWNKWSVLGPAAGIAEDIATIFQHSMGENKVFTENDAKKAIRLVPLTGTLGLRGLLNKWAESLDLPDRQPQSR
jgi:hypothetical protein